MRLRTIGHPLTDTLIAALEACNIKSDTDLIFSGTPTDIWLRLPPNTVSLKELESIVKQVLQKLSAAGSTGSELLVQENSKRERLSVVELSSGVQALDDLVGGFGYQEILEVSGEKGSGKTALALQIVLYQLARYPNSSAVWIDTTGDASPDRMMFMLEHYKDLDGYPTALQRLQITRAFDVDALENAFEEIRIGLSSRFNLGQPPVRTVVIDSVTPLFRPLLSAVTSQGHVTMVSVMQQLRSLGDSFPLTFLVLNDTSASLPTNANSVFASTTRKPALGASFTYLSDATLWMTKWTADFGLRAEEADKGEIYVAELFRSKSMATRRWCTFRMTAGSLLNDTLPSVVNSA